MMSLAGLLAAVAEDSQLSTALASPPDLPGGERDLVAPPALRPLIVAALAAGVGGGGTGAGGDGPGRFVLAVTATAREAEDLTAALGAFLPPDTVASFPGWETLPHERLSPRSDTVGQRIAVLRRLTHPLGGMGGEEPPMQEDARRPAQGRRRAGAERAAADRGRARRPGAGPAARRRRGRPGRRDRAAGRHRLRAHGDGHQARRARGPRRTARCVPADRGAPAADRVLRRLGRGDPRLQGRRPAQLRPLVSRPVGAALPRAAPYSRRPGQGQGTRRLPSQPRRAARQDRRRDRGRGHGGVRFGARRPDGAAARPRAARRRRARLRPRAHQDQGDGAGRHQPGVPRGVLGERRRGRGGTRRPRRGGVPADLEDPRGGRRPWRALVDAGPVRARCRRGGR